MKMDNLFLKTIILMATCNLDRLFSKGELQKARPNWLLSKGELEKASLNWLWQVIFEIEKIKPWK